MPNAAQFITPKDRNKLNKTVTNSIDEQDHPFESKNLGNHVRLTSTEKQLSLEDLVTKVLQNKIDPTNFDTSFITEKQKERVRTYLLYSSYFSNYRPYVLNKEKGEELEHQFAQEEQEKQEQQQAKAYLTELPEVPNTTRNKATFPDPIDYQKAKWVHKEMYKNNFNIPPPNGRYIEEACRQRKLDLEERVRKEQLQFDFEEKIHSIFDPMSMNHDKSADKMDQYLQDQTNKIQWKSYLTKMHKLSNRNLTDIPEIFKPFKFKDNEEAIKKTAQVLDGTFDFRKDATKIEKLMETARSPLPKHQPPSINELKLFPGNKAYIKHLEETSDFRWTYPDYSEIYPELYINRNWREALKKNKAETEADVGSLEQTSRKGHHMTVPSNMAQNSPNLRTSSSKEHLSIKSSKKSKKKVSKSYHPSKIDTKSSKKSFDKI